MCYRTLGLTFFCGAAASKDPVVETNLARLETNISRADAELVALSGPGGPGSRPGNSKIRITRASQKRSRPSSWRLYFSGAGLSLLSKRRRTNFGAHVHLVVLIASSTCWGLSRREYGHRGENNSPESPCHTHNTRASPQIATIRLGRLHGKQSPEKSGFASKSTRTRRTLADPFAHSSTPPEGERARPRGTETRGPRRRAH